MLRCSTGSDGFWPNVTQTTAVKCARMRGSRATAAARIVLPLPPMPRAETLAQRCCASSGTLVSRSRAAAALAAGQSPASAPFWPLTTPNACRQESCRESGRRLDAGGPRRAGRQERRGRRPCDYAATPPWAAKGAGSHASWWQQCRLLLPGECCERRQARALSI
eukprot:scaffold11828_cov63-Phaeocystis_antarctica.AAC.7